MWPAVAALMIVGYLCFSRSFAYLGVPPIHLFIGEIILGSFFIWAPRFSCGTWPWGALKSPALSRFRKAFFVLFAYGVFQVIRGITLGHPVFYAVRDLAFNYYPFYFFLGLWAGLGDVSFLRRCLHFAAWVNGVYGLLYILFFNRIAWFFPGVSSDVEPVPIFGQPQYSAVILLALLAFEKDLRRVWLLTLLNLAVLVGMLIRAEWASFAVGLLVWLCVTKKFRRIAFVGAASVALLAVMYVSGFSYEGPETRGRVISARDLVGQVAAPFNKDLAETYSSDSGSLEMSEGTTLWRTMYWTEILYGVHENLVRTLLGFGYGFSLGDLVAYMNVLNVRTPHSFFFFTLGYTGWIGVALYLTFQFELARLLWKTHRVSGQPFGIVYWVATLVFASFTPFFEAPQGAIPFYLIVGCSCAALFRVAGRANVVERLVLAPAH